MSKIILGTAQLGHAYGIANTRGKIPKDESFEILHEAANGGVTALDTAQAYGESEELIGEYHGSHSNRFKVISKVIGTKELQGEDAVRGSLERMKVDALEGCLVHGYHAFAEDPGLWGLLEQAKSAGSIKKIGFSLYHPVELESIIRSDLDIDIIQVPYSVFDQRFKDYFPTLNGRGIEIHVRSVFLQGLVFLSPEQLDEHFSAFRSKLNRFQALAQSSDVPLVHMCLNYVLSNEHVDAVLIGVDSIQNMKDILQWHHFTDTVNQLRDELTSFREADEAIIVPTMWNQT